MTGVNDNSADFYYEVGRSMYFREGGRGRHHQRGWQYLNRAMREGHVEAMYLIGYTAYVNPFSEQIIITDPEGNAIRLTKADGWDLIREAAERGSLQAKNYMDRKFDKDFSARESGTPVPGGSKNPSAHEKSMNDYVGPLKDFDGKRISIRREGTLTPVDAVLRYEDGVNILEFSLNLKFYYYDEIEEREEFEAAVRDGIKAWEGTYTVFGGQKVEIRIRITDEDRLFDNVTFMPCTESLEEMIGDAVKMLEHAETDFLKKSRHLLEHSAGAAYGGLKWSVHSRKRVIIRSMSGLFSNHDYVMNITRHEFGHVLGIGDLYRDPGQKFTGIRPGRYYDLDPFYVADGKYDLVMCDVNGRISGNDIEMVILAFSENRMQLYQPGTRGGVISKALGRGN